jgi:long-chain acyl-CoA synthetase
MNEKIWLKNYPKGIPAEIDTNRYGSLLALLEEVFAKFAGKPAYHNLGYTMTYTELERLSRDFAAFLQNLPGLARGDRVAVMMPNLLQYPVVLFGILRAGLTVVNVNPLYTPRELEYQLKDSGAKAIVILENFANTLQRVIKRTVVEHVITTQPGDLLPLPKRWIVNFMVKHVKKMVPGWRIDGAVALPAALARGAAAQFKPVSLTHEDIAFLQYTGGTTGSAKGAMLTHRNILANLEQTGIWLSTDFEEGKEIVIAPLPLYHIFCLTSTLSFMKWGSLTVLITNPRDLPAFVKELRQWKFTAMTGVNTLFNALLNTPGFAKLDFSGIKVVVGGGAPVQKAVADRWQEATGHYLTEAYGLTESSPGACANPLGVPWNGTIGLPLSSTEVSIRDKEDKVVSFGTVGEICVRGPQVMKGYWNMPEATAEVLTADGWLRTGDLGAMDERGYVRIIDRLKDMILVSGFNVYPTEIEEVAAMHPGVLESAAVGMPDEKSGEAVKLFAVRKDPGLSAEALIRHCRDNLTGYKVPKSIEFRSELPKSPIGKILRRQLREELH